MLRHRKSSFWNCLRMLLAGMLVFQPVVFGAAERTNSKDKEIKVGVRFPNGKEMYFQKCSQVDVDAQSAQITSGGSSDCLDLTPLHIAAMTRSGKVQDLLEAGADLGAVAVGGLTPLHVALQSRNYDSVKTLLEYGADPLATADSGVLPLQLLYAPECSPCEDDSTPVTTSVANRQEIARLLIREGVQINGTDSTGATALHYAVMDPVAALKKVDELRELGGDVGIKDNNGTPLSFYAALAGNTAAAERVRLLAGHSADEVDNDGVGKEAWVESKRTAMDSVANSFQPEDITRTIKNPAGFSFGYWFDLFCNLGIGMGGCWGACTLFAPAGPGGYAACIIACSIWSFHLCYWEGQNRD